MLLALTAALLVSGAGPNLPKPTMAKLASGGITGANAGTPFGSYTARPLITTAGLDPNDPRYATPKGGAYDGVVSIFIADVNTPTTHQAFICSGALMADRRHILTAGHCLSHGAGNIFATQATVVFFPPSVPSSGATTMATTTFTVNPNYTGGVVDEHDVAIIDLGADAPAGINGYSLYSGNGVSKTFNAAGSGATGNGATGVFPDDPGLPGFGLSNRRQGLNRFDFSFADPGWGGFWKPFLTGNTAGVDVYVSDFDSGLAANDASCLLAADFGLGGSKFCNLGEGLDEVNVAGGDSGGPEFINGQIAGVTSFGLTFIDNAGQPVFGDVDGLLNGSFGEYAGFTRIDKNLRWIYDTTIPEPITMTLLGTGLLGMGGAGVLRRRKRQSRAARYCRAATVLAAFTLSCSSMPKPQEPAGAEGNKKPQQSDAVACTMMFAMVNVRVVDAAGQPVKDAQVSVKRLKTGETRTLSDTSLPELGSYTIADDSMRERIDPDGETFEVTAKAGGKQATGSYKIGVTMPGRCHVTTLAGPAELVLK